MNCTTAGLGLGLGRSAPRRTSGSEDHGLVDPFVIERFLLRRRRLVRPFGKAGLAHQREDRGRHGAIAAVPVHEGLPDRAHDVRAVAEHVLHFGLLAQRQILEHHGQIVRELVARGFEAGLRIERLELHHRLAARARIAMHVLEQVQRRRPPAIEQGDVVFLRVEEIDAREPRDQHVERASLEAGRAEVPGRGSPRSPAARRRAPPTDTKAAPPAPSRWRSHAPRSALRAVPPGGRAPWGGPAALMTSSSPGGRRSGSSSSSCRRRGSPRSRRPSSRCRTRSRNCRACRRRPRRIRGAWSG